jgi:hypothetical protein
VGAEVRIAKVGDVPELVPNQCLTLIFLERQKFRAWSTVDGEVRIPTSVGAFPIVPMPFVTLCRFLNVLRSPHLLNDLAEPSLLREVICT